jgi:hypothetical protein
VNSGEHFEPVATVPVSADIFVRRVARTPHYDGVKKGEREPAIIGIVSRAHHPKGRRMERSDTVVRTAMVVTRERGWSAHPNRENDTKRTLARYCGALGTKNIDEIRKREVI